MSGAPLPRVVIPATTARDRFIALGIGGIVLAFVIFGVLSMGGKHVSPNLVTGVITAKQFTPQREDQVSFSGRKLLAARAIEGEYLFKVRVEKEARTYDVPVEKAVYEAKQQGDKLEFVRPRSEQR